MSDNDKLAIAVRYGTSVLELAKSKYAVEVATANDLVSTLEIIKDAVEIGEPDNTIDFTANKLHNGFRKWRHTNFGCALATHKQHTH